MNKLSEKLKRDFQIQKDCHSSDTIIIDNQLSLNCQKYLTDQIEFTPALRPDSHFEQLKEKYQPINKMNEDTPSLTLTTPPANEIPQPGKVLYNSESLHMKWSNPHPIGSGLCNLGNTCFLNSVLQCLTYTPPLYNYLLSNHHKTNCSHQGFCSMCELHSHVTRVFKAEGVVKPLPIVHHLKDFAKHLRFGRQEDAHEFLRYFIESLQKVCLRGLPPKMDVYTKCTTVIHQIFGGYHRSQVKCLKCKKTSNTYDPLLDISLDIKGCPTLLQALKQSIKPDMLDNDNKYACPFCKELTRAKKQFTIHSLPNVLTVQLKRFEYNTLFGGKINKAVHYPEHLDMRPFMSEPQGPNEWYSLYAVLVHFGFSCNSGHYYCYVKNSNNVWYSMNDTLVNQVSQKTVLSQEAYLLFYIKDVDYSPPPSLSSPVTPLVKTIGPATKAQFNGRSVGVPIKRNSAENNENIRLKPTGVVTPSPKVISSPSPLSSSCVDNKIPVSHFNKPFRPTTPTTKPSNLVTPRPSNLTTPILPTPKDMPKTTPTAFIPRSVSKSKPSPVRLDVPVDTNKKTLKVAYVAPIPSSKPIARVPPSPQIKQEMETTPSSDNKKGHEKTPPNSNSDSEKGTEGIPVMYGPALPPDHVQGTSPTNWKVTSLNETPLREEVKKDDSKKISFKKRRKSSSSHHIRDKSSHASKDSETNSKHKHTPIKERKFEGERKRHHSSSCSSSDENERNERNNKRKKSKPTFSQHNKHKKTTHHSHHHSDTSDSERKIDNKKYYHSKSYRHRSSPIRSCKSPKASPVRSRKSPKASPIRSRKSPKASPVRSRKSPKASPVRSHKSPKVSPVRSCKNPEASPVRSHKKSPERSFHSRKYEKRRKSSPFYSSSSQKQHKEVEELKWDRIHPPYRTPVPNSRETNGSCSSSSNVVLDTLEKSDQLGSKVKTWDGEKNSIDSSSSIFRTPDMKRRGRDDWDKEIDQGKVKKIKRKSSNDWSSSSKNKFQSYQNKKKSKRF